MGDEVKANKMKVLHVLGGLDRGGAETWLMHVLRHVDRERFQFDFLVHTDRRCAYDDEARELGARLINNPDPHNPLVYGYRFVRNYREYGPYDVVHSHVHHYSGYVLWLAKLCGAPKRIAHSHNDTREAEAGAGIARQAYLEIMKKMIGRYASHGICASRKAAEALFGDAWESDGRWRLLYYGIDLSPFGENVDGERVRRELGIPEKAYVIGHVGNFREQKNHVYLMDIAASLVESGADCYWFLLIGDGPLRPRIKRRAEELGLADKVIFAGARSDVPKLMLGAMDLFLFPSLYEGLPVALLEAQAAGLPCVISDVISEEVDVIKENMHRLSLGEPPAVWADAIQAIRKSRKVCSLKECVEMMKNSRFNIATCVSQIEELYSGG